MAFKSINAWKRARPEITPQPTGGEIRSNPMATAVQAPRRRATLPAKGFRFRVPSVVVKRRADDWKIRWLTTARVRPMIRPGAKRG
jgi:hypothetical protein